MILVTLQSYLYTLHDTVSGNSGAPIGSLEKSSRQGETYTTIVLHVSDWIENGLKSVVKTGDTDIVTLVLVHYT